MQVRTTRLEADVGLVGFPSVGKSTLLSVVSSAKPKIGAYHFTTIVPNLGMVETEDGRSFAMADLPGLIEGAHQGVGLGMQFLRHIERTRVIVHVIDMSGIEGREPYEDYVTINNELEQYNLRLLERPQIVVANKMDMPGAEENLEEFKKKVGEDVKIFPISAVSRQGLKPLLFEIADLLEVTPEFNHLGVVCHIPLRNVIRDTSLMNATEIKYATHPNTHLDFLILNHVTKKPLLAIETDGYRFHNEQTEQHQRDILKDHILTVYGLPILRLSTNGSGEKESVISELRNMI